MNKYYVNVEANKYLVLDTNSGKTYPFSLNVKCSPEISRFAVYKSTKESLEKYLLVSYAQLVVITESTSILYVAKREAEAARTSTPEYRLKLALTCLLDQTRRLSGNDAVYDDINDLSIDLDEVQDICDGIEVVL
jgi:hypothetical protein